MNSTRKKNRDYRVDIEIEDVQPQKGHHIIVQEGPGGFSIHYQKTAATSKP